ncbi:MULTISPECIES: DegT/DnrJ/EryC1/StrS family aminotransferase [Spirulina sp. CCY15215]|uniref:DegT/DnrJ/EryC1/StrS family aminotransferase n=1 Tax=Spirulina sp. CCY15215 TaxID=2767591 RepID=UPI00194DE90F
MEKLALLGGKPVLPQPLPPYRSLGDAEVKAVAEVMRSGCLSGFYGSWGAEFFGGPCVQTLEQSWQERFQVPHAISVNSATSGLYAAMGAIGLSPGEEVILPPYTMSATAMAPLLYGGIPVFADIDRETFCLDPEAVCQAITPKTRAILAVNLFGHPAPLTQLKAIAEKNNLYLIEDNAQSPLAEENQCYAGTIGDISIFSLNYHKHIHTGEGGICVTRDDRLAQRLQLIRNHGENAVEALKLDDLTNLIGFNYRMTEMSAAVGIEQIKQIDAHVKRRERLGQNLSAGIADLDGLTPPLVRPNCRHVYYVWAMRFDEKIVEISRQKFSQALSAEGFPHFIGYVRPLYFLPIFQKRIAIGDRGFPFTLSDRHYHRGLCPVTEKMYEQELLGFEPCAYAIDDETCDRLIEALRKVYHQRHLLIESTRDSL